MDQHLADTLDQLRGINSNLDTIADALENLHHRTYTLDERQTVIARLTGNADDDLVTALALLTQHLCTRIPATPALDDTDRKALEQHGQDTALWLTDWRLRQPAAEAAALLETAGGRCTAVTDKEREELSKKVREANKRSEQRPR
jgi:hypothetical protein